MVGAEEVVVVLPDRRRISFKMKCTKKGFIVFNKENVSFNSIILVLNYINYPLNYY